MTAARIDWPAVIDRAREIVESYDTSVTLRQLFYRLVSTQVIPNSQVAYKRPSAVTAEARRGGTFPALIDRGRTIHECQWFTGTGHALTWLSRIYRLDRTRDQDVSLYLGVEKAGMVVQLQSWVRRSRRPGAGARRVQLADLHRRRRRPRRRPGAACRAAVRR
jgi:hypothetical protein